MDRDLTILIAEDLPDDVQLLREALTRAGIRNPIQVVGDGQEAINYLCGAGPYADRCHHPLPSVIFTDLNMPRMNGFDLLQWLRAHPERSVVPVMILSASARDEDIRKAYEMGANAYLVKPIKLNDLVEVVRTAFEFWAWCEKPKLHSSRTAEVFAK